MDIVVSILIASVISLGISIYFHEVSKKNNAMERVKRYADERKKDMDESFKQLEGNFNILIAEFDTRQAQANAAVKRLSEQNEDFAQKIKTLDNSIKSVEKIENQINSYSTLLNDLNEMTEQVEENLLRIQKESGIVNKLNDRLDKQQQTVDSIDKKIPQISEHFSKENEEQLKAVGTTLLDEYKSYAEKIAAEIKHSQNEAENALAKIKQQIQDAYNQAAAKAESLENTAFDHLSQQATERSQQYIAELKAQNEQLDSKMTQSFKDSETKLVAQVKADLTKMNDNFQQSIEKLSNNYTQKVQELHDKYNEQLDSIAGKNEGIITKLETQFNSDFTRIDQKCKSDFEKISERYEESYSTLNQKYDTDYQNLSAKYDEAVAKISQKYDSQLGSIGAKGDKEISDIEARITADIERLRNDYSKSFDTATAVNNKKINEFNESFVAEHQRLKEEYETAITRLAQESTGKIIDLENGVKAEIDRISSESTGKIESLENSVNTEISEFSDECKEQINGLQNEYTHDLNEFKNDIGSRLSTVESEYESKTAALESNIQELTERYGTQEEGLQKVFGERLNALDEDYKQRIAEIRLSLEESIKKCNETTEFLKHDVDGNSKSLETIQAELDEEIRIMQEKYSGLYRDALASADQKEKDALDSFNAAVTAKVDEYEQLIQQKIDALEASITDKIKNVSLNSSNSIHEAESAIADLQKECSAANQKAQEMQPQLDERIKIINKELEDFKTDAEIKLNNMNKYISDTVKRSVAESEQTHLNILEGIDEQLCSYKKDIEHKLTQIQHSGADVDTLEKSLRSAMQEVQNKVLGDFDSFTKEQQKRHEVFSEQINQDSENIETRLHEIDKSLDELKATATGSMSAKLEDFQKAFNDNILTTNNEIEAQISDWKVKLDSELAGITSTYEGGRKDIEQHYQEELRAGLVSLQNRTVEQYDKLADAVEKTKLAMEKNIDEIQSTFGDFQEETRTKIAQISTATDKELKDEIDRTVNNVQVNLNRVQEKLLADLKSFEDSIKERQDTGSSSIDAALSEFNTWKQQLRSQFEGANTLFQEELEAFKATSENTLEETRQKVSEDMLNYAANIQDQQNELNDKIESLQNKTEASVKEYEERSEQIINQLNETYTKMLTDTEERVRAQNSDSAQSLAQLKKDIQTASEQNRANQAEFVMKMQNDANDMQLRMGELTKDLQQINANIQQFERADAMKRQLDANMDDLNSRFEKLDKFTDTAEDINKQYNAIIRLNDEMAKKLEEIDQQKQRVVSLEQKFGQMFALSNSIDERIKSLNTTSDDIGTMEVAVRDYRDKLDIVSQQYERLEKKEDVINRVLKDVDTSFANLKNMEQRITDSERQITSLPNEIKAVQSDVDRLLQNGPKITEAASRLQKLDTVLGETEKRMETLTSANDGIKRTLLSQQELQREIKNMFATLQQITKQDLSKSKPAADKAMTPQVRDAIRTLRRDGWTIEQLADRFNRSIEEIDLLLQLPD